MAFTPVLTPTQLDVLRTGSFGANVLMLVWDQVVIFEAQINQATFTSSFATVTYDNVSVGAYTDIKSDFICYIDSTKGNIRDAQHRFRVRADGSGTVASASILNINETSAALEDDWYIMVVKDVGCDAKVPKTITAADPSGYDYARDYAITFRRLLGTIYGLQSAYAGKLNSDGYVDFDWPAQALVADNDASAATWLWDIDGLSYQSGSSSTAAITARATAAGQYMPRVTHTDDAGNSWYFTFRVWVVPADYSSTVNLAFSNFAIDHDLTNGLSLSVSAPAASNASLITRIDRMPDLSFCAVWVDTQQPVPTSNIAFCGWFLQETIQNTFTSDGNTLLNTQFQCQGIAGRMSETISRRVQMIEDLTPTVFGEIEDLTPWRAIVYFLTEHTTVPNIAAVQFSDTSEVFRYPRFASTDSSVLGSVLDILFTINGAVEYSRSGGLYLDRKAWMLPTSDRNALDTVANWTTSDMATGENGGPLFSITRAMAPKIGREMGGGGYYNTTSLDVQVLKATTPAVAQSQGNELVTYNRQILAANSDVVTAGNELGQRNADDMEARNPQTIMPVTFPPAYWWHQAHAGQWHTWTINKTDNNRGVSYTTATRWILRRISINYQIERGIWSVRGDFQKETQGTSWQSLSQLPLNGQVSYFNPVMPVAPAYQAYPESPVANFPDPTAPDDEDAPPFDADDVGVVSRPQQPGNWVANNQTYNNSDGMVWDDDSLWGVSNIPGTPSFIDLTPPDAGTITNGKFNKHDNRAWCLSNDGTDSKVHRTAAFGDLAWISEDQDGVYIRIGLTSTDGDLYCYSAGSGFTHTFDFTIDAQSWERNTNVTLERGVYAAGVGWQFSDSGIRIKIDFLADPTLIYYMKVTYDSGAGGSSKVWEFGFGNPGNSIDEDLEADDPNVARSVSNWSEGSAQSYDVSGGPVSATRLYCYPVGTSITMDLYEVEVRGIGANPFGAGGGTGDAATIFSEDHGETFATPVIPGSLSSSEGGFDVLRVDVLGKAYVGIDEAIQEADQGGSYSAAPGGTTTGTFALCIWAYGTDGDKYLFGTDAAIGGESVWYVEGGSATAITPNDGANDGIVASPDSLCTDPASDLRIFGLFDFGGTVKFAYSADQGTTWQFNTQISNSAVYIRCKYTAGSYHVYIADAAFLWYGQWDGDGSSVITLYAKTTQSTALKGVEVR